MICVHRTHAHTYTHGSWRGKSTGWGRGERHVSRSLVRSSNEESSRVLARRSARSVSTRLAIGQHGEREAGAAPGRPALFFFLSLPFAISAVSVFSALRPERYFVELTSIDDAAGYRPRGETPQRILHSCGSPCSLSFHSLRSVIT